MSEVGEALLSLKTMKEKYEKVMKQNENIRECYDGSGVGIRFNLQGKKKTEENIMRLGKERDQALRNVCIRQKTL